MAAIESAMRGSGPERHHPRSAAMCAGGRVRDRATVIQKKTGRLVQFEITEQARTAISEWLSELAGRSGRYLFPSRSGNSRTCRHASTPASFIDGCAI